MNAEKELFGRTRFYRMNRYAACYGGMSLNEDHKLLFSEIPRSLAKGDGQVISVGGVILDIQDVKDLDGYHGCARGVFHLGIKED